MGLVTVYKRALGVNNRLDPSRLPYDHESLSGSLSSCVGMRIDTSGGPYRDFGYAMQRSGNFHSLYCRDGVTCLAGKGKGLYQIVRDGSGIIERGLRDSLSGLRISFCQVGEQIFYSDGLSKNGVVTGGVSMDWPSHRYLQQTDRVFTHAPVARHMAEINGRMFMNPVSHPDIIVWSERGQLGLYNLGESFRRLEGPIRMIASVPPDGLFVSTDQRTVFFRVSDRVKLEPADTKPVVEWSLADMPIACRSLGFDLPGEARIWRTEVGPCAGLPTGDVVPMIEGSIVLSPGCANSGASILVGDYLYSTAG